MIEELTQLAGAGSALTLALVLARLVAIWTSAPHREARQRRRVQQCCVDRPNQIASRSSRPPGN